MTSKGWVLTSSGKGGRVSAGMMGEKAFTGIKRTKELYIQICNLKHHGKLPRVLTYKSKCFRIMGWDDKS